MTTSLPATKELTVSSASPSEYRMHVANGSSSHTARAASWPFGGPVLDAPVPVAGTGAAHRQGAQEVVAEPAVGAPCRDGHKYLGGGTAAGTDDQYRTRARWSPIVARPGQPPLVNDGYAMPRAGRRRIDARVVEQRAVGGVQALLGVITQQGARPAERPVLDLSGGLPGHVTDLALHANPGRIHIFHLT